MHFNILQVLYAKKRMQLFSQQLLWRVVISRHYFNNQFIFVFQNITKRALHARYLFPYLINLFNNLYLVYQVYFRRILLFLFLFSFFSFVHARIFTFIYSLQSCFIFRILMTDFLQQSRKYTYTHICIHINNTCQTHTPFYPL